jgi:hypothetical protein
MEELHGQNLTSKTSVEWTKNSAVASPIATRQAAMLKDLRPVIAPRYPRNKRKKMITITRLLLKGKSL